MSGRRRVLVVDDDRSIADSLALVLRCAGHDALAAYSAEDAVFILPDFLPDVVIADVIMGPIDGIDLAIYVAKLYPNCCVLLSSGDLRSNKLIAKSIEQGYRFPLLAKPVLPQEFIAFVERSCKEIESDYPAAITKVEND